LARGKHRRGGCLSRLIAFALLAFVLIYPFYQARTLYVEQKTLEENGLDPDLDGLTIVYVSDIHQGPFFSQGRVDALIAKINSINADLVLLGGDYANDSDGAVEFFQNMPKIQARRLVAGVMGNHDRTVPESNLNTLQSAMINAGVLPLVNDVREVRVGDSVLYLCGVDDYNNGYPQISQVAYPMRKDDFVIFLTHSPDNLPEAFDTKNSEGTANWFDLALCGHTHGGQVTFFGKPLFRTFTKVSDRYLSGWLQENKADILVSNGVGTSWVPVRLFAPAQLHVITLKRK
jgi:predicted MPP superfamily phosphohydrolase